MNYASLTFMKRTRDTGTVKGIGKLGRRRFLGVLGASGAVGLLMGCPGNGGGPSPTPSPSPTGTPTNLPNGIPNSTMLQNLALVTSLAQRFRPGAFLSRQSTGGASLTGHLLQGLNAWEFFFTFPRGSQTGVDVWDVYYDGHLEYSPDVAAPRRWASVDIAPQILLDSPQALIRAMGYGLAECVAARPQEILSVGYTVEQRIGATVPIISIVPLGAGSQSLGECVISPGTGELYSEKFFC